MVGPNPLPDLTHVVLALESCSYLDPDFFAFAVLNSLMGGGGSFSAGGPGKGMYTRLYQDVLTRHHWVYSALAQNHAYSDSGIFCLFGSSHPSKVWRDLSLPPAALHPFSLLIPSLFSLPSSSLLSHPPSLPPFLSLPSFFSFLLLFLPSFLRPGS